MDEILTKKTTSITEFKANPNREVAAAGDEPFAVLTNNRPSFYVMSPKAYDALLEHIWDLKVAQDVRHSANEQRVRVNIEDLLAGNLPSDAGDRENEDVA
jgi:antitoxin StbD